MQPPFSLADFHAGSAGALERCYREHFKDVDRAVARIVQGVDRENVIHHVFYRLVTDEHLRTNFRGGNLAAWLTTVARNAAIDYRRVHARAEARDAASAAAEEQTSPAAAMDAKLLLERFCRDHLTEKLRPIFDARFLRELSQREAAAELGMERTTLAYQEQQIRDALRAFLLEEP